MVVKMYSAFDRNIGVWSFPFPALNRADAIRKVEVGASRSDSPWFRWPQHFDLFEIGEFHDVEGDYVIEKSPEFVCKMTDVLNKESDDGDSGRQES